MEQIGEGRSGARLWIVKFATPFEHPSGDIREPAGTEVRGSGRASGWRYKCGISCQQTG